MNRHLIFEKGEKPLSKYILNFAPTGLVPTKAMNPHVPITPEEICEQVLEAAELGISMAHLHARNPDSAEPTFDKDVYADIIRGIRKENRKLVLVVSTSGRVFEEFDKRSECLELNGELKPDFASLTLSSMNFSREASLNSPDMIHKLLDKMKKNAIRPELEAFDTGMLNYARYLLRKEHLSLPLYANLILGNIATAQMDMLNLGLMIKELPQGTIWSTGGIGAAQLTANILGILAGGGARVGLEDNLFIDDERTIPATNRLLLERVIRIAAEWDRAPYSPSETRRLLRLE